MPGKDIDAMETKAQVIAQLVKDVPEAENILMFIGDWGAMLYCPLKP